MKVINALKKIFLLKARYWYIIVTIFTVISILNYGILSYVVPDWVCHIIFICLMLLMTCYVSVMCDFVKEKFRIYMQQRKEGLFDRLSVLQYEINELYNTSTELQKELYNSVVEALNENTTKILDTVNENSNYINSRIEGNSKILIDKLDTSKDEIEKELNRKTDMLSSKLTEDEKTIREYIEKAKSSIIELSENIKTDITNNFANATNKMVELHSELSTKLETNSSQIDETIKLQKEYLYDVIAEKQNDTKDTIKNVENNITNFVNNEIAKIHLENEENSNKFIENISSIKNELGENNRGEFAVVKEMISKASAENENNTTKSKEELASHISNTQAAINETLKEAEESANKSRADMMDKLEWSSELFVKNINEQSISIISSFETKISETTDFLKEKTETEISVVKDSIVDAKNTVSEQINLSESKVASNITAIDDELRKTKDSISNSITQTCEAIKENNGANMTDIAEKLCDIETKQECAINYYETLNASLKTDLSEIKNVLEDKTESIKEKTECTQNELSKQLNKILEEQNHLSNSSTENTDKILSVIAQYTESINNKAKILEEFANSTYKKINDDIVALSLMKKSQDQKQDTIAQKVDENAELCKNYQVVLQERIDNLQNQVANLNVLLETIKNISVMVKADTRDKQPDAYEKKPNRTEKIKDEKSGNTIINSYENAKLTRSEIIKGNKKIYEAFYNTNGQVSKSRAFNKKGEVVSEIEFHKNGEVKTRTEKLKENGKVKSVTSKFDEQGKKIQ